MTKFIAVECIRDYTLSAAIMQIIPHIFEVENSTRGLNTHQFIEINEKGVVERCVMLIVEDVTATVLLTHDVTLSEVEALVKECLPVVTQMQGFVLNIEAKPADWNTSVINYRSRIGAAVLDYSFSDTDNPVLKTCHTKRGDVLCTIVGHHMCVAVKDEPCSREIQQTLDTIAGVAAAEGKTFAIQALSKSWCESLEGNPNYVFQNCTVQKIF